MSSEAITKNDLIAILSELGMPYSMLDYYPIGSYFWTSDADYNPEDSMGGEWELMDEGITLVSAGQTYTVQSGTSKDGGEETVTLNTNQIPSHTHPSPSNGQFIINKSQSSGYAFAFSAGSYYRMAASETGARGGGQAHENMPPYKAAYCWHRIG